MASAGLPRANVAYKARTLWSIKKAFPGFRKQPKTIVRKSIIIKIHLSVNIAPTQNKCIHLLLENRIKFTKNYFIIFIKNVLKILDP